MNHSSIIFDKNNATIVASNSNLISKQTLSLIKKYSVNLIAGVPLHYEQLLSGRFFKSKYSDSITTYLQAGGPLKKDTQTKLYEQRKSSNFSFISMYGQVEATTRISVANSSDFDSLSGTVGRPLDGVCVEIKPLKGFAQNGYSVGEITCSGPNICPEYVYRYTDLHKLCERPDGTLHTGDIGYIDERGNLFITGRIKRFAKIRSISYNLDDIEDDLFSITNEAIPCVERNETLYVFCNPISELANIHNDIRKRLWSYGLMDFCIRDDITVPMLSNGKVDYMGLSKANSDENS